MDKKLEEKIKSEKDQKECLRINFLYCICKPFLILMRLGGLFFILPSSIRSLKSNNKVGNLSTATKNDNIPVVQERSSNPTAHPKREAFERLSICYCFLGFLFIIVFCGKFLYGFAVGVGQLQFTEKDFGSIVAHIAYALWILQLLCIHAIFLKACWKKNEMFTFFMSWEKMRYNCPNPDHGSIFRETFIRRRNVISGFAVLHLVAQLMTLYAPLFIPSKEYTQLKHSFMEGFDANNVVVLALTAVGAWFACYVYIIPSYFFMIIASVFACDFQHLSHDLSEHITNNGCMTSELEWYRLRHSTLCMLLDIADNIFSPFNLLVLGGSVVQILFQIFVLYAYSEHYGAMSFIVAVTNVFWLLTYFIQIALVLWLGAVVNKTAHSPLLMLYQINQSKLSIQEALQLQTFLNKLSCNRIGFTAWKMFTIDYSAILALFGLFVTHQLLVFQLQLELQLEAKVEEHRCDCIDKLTLKERTKHGEIKQEL